MAGNSEGIMPGNPAGQGIHAGQTAKKVNKRQ